MFAVIITRPKSNRLSTSPGRFFRTVERTPMGNTIALIGRNELKILLYNKLVVLTHGLMLLSGNITGSNGIALFINQAHIELSNLNQFSGSRQDRKSTRLNSS